MALAVTAEGHRDILGFAAVGEGAKRWLRVLTELKSRGVGDVLMLVCDGLKSRPTRLARSRLGPSRKRSPSTPCGSCRASRQA
ncbi:transposase [Streptomyces sp. NBC_01077]|nr:transposase [Streptomyces sp. NBC_01077]WSV43718.1 transposase [Streptomyces sp. NBC_01077]